jgi:hypothetical protein
MNCGPVCIIIMNDFDTLQITERVAEVVRNTVDMSDSHGRDFHSDFLYLVKVRKCAPYLKGDPFLDD